ncbi:hypothetical protein NIES3807_19560 [Microcystis aeruginosa NIES-3807]|uniref:Uncharacterized protein n=1 Tax=Microcystis aeruginosa NIES-3807 TaxID=2517785 RepID=A0AAD3B076_MICAE|nr:hypothetical protein NIES3807_19560 [Microcystis aeruginosa NIES-3807]
MLVLKKRSPLPCPRVTITASTTPSCDSVTTKPEMLPSSRSAMMSGVAIRAVPSSPLSPILPLKDWESLATPSLPLAPSRLPPVLNTGYTLPLPVEVSSGEPLILAQPRRASPRYRETGLLVQGVSITVPLLTVSRSTQPR